MHWKALQLFDGYVYQRQKLLLEYSWDWLTTKNQKYYYWNICSVWMCSWQSSKTFRFWVDIFTSAPLSVGPKQLRVIAHLGCTANYAFLKIYLNLIQIKLLTKHNHYLKYWTSFTVGPKLYLDFWSRTLTNAFFFHFLGPQVQVPLG